MSLNFFRYNISFTITKEDKLEELIRKYIETQDVPGIQFAWQGGEPMLLRIDFYREAVNR